MSSHVHICAMEYRQLITTGISANLFKLGKINCNNANYYDNSMMAKIKAPLFSHKNPAIYYQFGVNENDMKTFGNFYLGSERSYDYSDVNSSSSSPKNWNYFNNYFFAKLM